MLQGFFCEDDCVLVALTRGRGAEGVAFESIRVAALSAVRGLEVSVCEDVSVVLFKFVLSRLHQDIFIY